MKTISRSNFINKYLLHIKSFSVSQLKQTFADSLDFSGILFNLEEVFGIEIPDEDIDSLQTINSISIYINRKK